MKTNNYVLLLIIIIMTKPTDTVLQKETEDAVFNQRISLEVKIPLIHKLTNLLKLKELALISTCVKTRGAAIRRIIFLMLNDLTIDDSVLIEIAKNEKELSLLLEILMFIRDDKSLNLISCYFKKERKLCHYRDTIISLRKRDIFFMSPQSPEKRDEKEQISVLSYLNLPSSVIEYANKSKSILVKSQAINLFFDIEDRVDDLKNILPVNFNRDFIEDMSKFLLQWQFKAQAITFSNSSIDQFSIVNSIEDDFEEESLRIYLLERTSNLNQDFIRNIAITSNNKKVRRKAGKLLKNKNDVIDLFDHEQSLFNRIIFRYLSFRL